MMLEQQLRAIPFFRNLPADALGAIATRLQLQTYEQGAVVFRRGDVSEAMYLVRSGRVDVVLEGAGPGGGEEPLASLGPGSFVGELGLLLDEPRSATLVAATDTELWALNRTELHALLAQHPAIALDLTQELGRRLVATNRKISPPALTRYTAVWGGGAPELARALTGIGAGRVGVFALPGAGPLSTLPPEVTAVSGEGFDAGVMTGWAGRQLEGLDHLLLVLPPGPDTLTRVAVKLAGHLVARTGAVPDWAIRPGLPVLRYDGSPPSLRRVARWVSGRAIGVAFSSGGSKCVAHMGVLRALREAGLEIDAVAGTSGGAMAAAALAFDIADSQMLAWLSELARNTRFRHFDYNLPPRSALFKGVRLRTLFDTWFGGRSFADAGIPLWTVATDVATGDEVVIGEGGVADGLRASMSIPGVFNPWPHAGRMLIDGAVVNPMPASVLRDAGVRFVIGSSVAGQDLAPMPTSGRAPHLLEIMSRMINSMEREMIKVQIPLVDVMIRPRVLASNSFDFTGVEAFVVEGERAAQEQLPQVLALLDRLGAARRRLSAGLR